MARGRRAVYTNRCEFRQGPQPCEVVEVAEVVEGFVGVFDCYFEGRGVGEVVRENGGVEAGAVATAVEGGEDDELRDAGAAGEGGEGNAGEGERGV